MASARWPRAILVAVLALAALLHLVLTPDHLGESALMGAGFAGAAVAEFGLALAVVVKPGRFVYAAVAIVAAALIALYAFNVMIGLPFAGSSAEAPEPGGHVGDAAHAASDHHGEGLMLGSGEPVDAYGAATKLSELAAIGLAVHLARRVRPR